MSPITCQVYRNLHNDMWSIRNAATGLVIGHALFVKLVTPKFIVREAGRQRVLQEQRKNVHAFVEGGLEMWYGVNYKGRQDLKGYHGLPSDDFLEGSTEVSYNPYKFGHFFDVQTLDKVDQARYAYFTPEKKVYRGAIL